MVVLIDNYDSFTYNVYHYLKHFRNDVSVILNSESVEKLKRMKSLEAIVISPGPSHPSKSMLSLEALDYFLGRIPILGICLGMQAIGYYFGATVRKARRIMHGKTDIITLGESRIFKDLPDRLLVVRYHSLVIDQLKTLTVTARSTTDNEIMAIEEKDAKVYGVQFHPESYLTQDGLKLIGNFLEVING